MLALMCEVSVQRHLHELYIKDRGLCQSYNRGRVQVCTGVIGREGAPA